MSRLVIEICRTELDHVYSRTLPLEESDHQTLAEWPGHGLGHVSFAILTEAIRREVRYSVLVKMSHDEDFKNRVLSGDTQDALDEMSDVVKGVIQKHMDLVVDSAIQECFHTLLGADNPSTS